MFLSIAGFDLDSQFETGQGGTEILRHEVRCALQALEVSEYDTVLSKLQKASIKTEGISATLNAGQSVILSIGLTAVLAVAALGSPGSAMTAGDLVLVQGLLLQLWGPLQVLGLLRATMLKMFLPATAISAWLSDRAG